MPQEKRTFWEMLFSGSPQESREKKVLQYVVHRIKEGARLEDAVRKDYVRHNLSESEIGDVIRNPEELVHAARERLEQAFGSGELRPGPFPR